MNWVSVKESYPKLENKPSIRVLVTDGTIVQEAVYRQAYGWNEERQDFVVVDHIFHTFCKECLEGNTLKNLTHWMYLPAPPLRSQ